VTSGLEAIGGLRGERLSWWQRVRFLGQHLLLNGPRRSRLSN
jgi:hypothetical protein